ncbi:MAG: hypothetical protein ABIH00_00330 [Armatimonadota bacterium]
MLHRTQLYLDEAMYQFLKNLAKIKNKSMAEVVRYIVDYYRSQTSEKDTLYEVMGIGNVKDNLASGYEDYLYGEDNK